MKIALEGRYPPPSCHLALISRAPLEHGISFNQLFVSMPGMDAKGSYSEVIKNNNNKLLSESDISTLGDGPLPSRTKRQEQPWL